jgi:hypothetical protein
MSQEEKKTGNNKEISVQMFDIEQDREKYRAKSKSLAGMK